MRYEVEGNADAEAFQFVADAPVFSDRGPGIFTTLPRVATPGDLMVTFGPNGAVAELSIFTAPHGLVDEHGSAITEFAPGTGTWVSLLGGTTGQAAPELLEWFPSTMYPAGQVVMLKDGDGYTLWRAHSDIQGSTFKPGETGASQKWYPMGGHAGGFQLLPAVANHAALPTAGNSIGNGRITLDTGILWTWNGHIWVDSGKIMGPPGPAGAKGDPGAAGAPGHDGAKGDPGADGHIGPAGAKGDTGAAGAAGATGTAGAKGDPGADGHIGPAGAKGDTGAAGAKGDPGLIGHDGPAGAKGDTGAAGAAGTVGHAGAKGDPGAAGHDGTGGAVGGAGPKGDQGTGIKVEGVVATIGDLPIHGNHPGDAHMVTSTGDLMIYVGAGQGTAGPPGHTDEWTDLGHIEGPQGPAGPAGTAGTKGDPGAVGHIGPDGPAGHVGAAGAKGDDGAAGAKGDPGAIGHDGPAGAKGDTGAAGHIGPPGSTGHIGPHGTKGDTGAAGAAGAKGDDGAKGDPGAQGHAGAAGPAGHIGPDGAKGDTGAAGAAGADAFAPTGAIVAFGGTAPPHGWSLCNGTVVSKAAPFDKLFAVIGHTYGPDPGGGKYHLPDFRGRSLVGPGTVAGTSTAHPLGSSYGTADSVVPLHDHVAGGLTMASHHHSIAHDHVAENTGNQSASHYHNVNPPKTNLVFGGARGATSIFQSKAGDAHYGGLTAHIGGGSGSDWGAHPYIDIGNFHSAAQSASHHHAVNLRAFAGNSGAPSSRVVGGTTAGTGGSKVEANYHPVVAVHWIIKL